jgi:autotransporter family porin
MNVLRHSSLAAAISATLFCSGTSAYASDELPLVFDGLDGEISPGAYTTSAANVAALSILNGAIVSGREVSFEATGANANGAILRGAGSELSLSDSSISSESATAIQMGAGTRADLRGMTISGLAGITGTGATTYLNLSNSTVTAATPFSMSAGASLKITGSNISALHADPMWAVQGVRLGGGATLDISDSTLRNDRGNGILATAGSAGTTITASNLRIYSHASNGGESISLVSGASLVARWLWITASDDAGAGVSAIRNSTFDVSDADISVGNERTSAVYVSGSQGVLRRADLSSDGDLGFGLAVTGAGRADYQIGNVVVRGNGSTGLYKGAGALMTVGGVDVQSLGNESWGLWAEGASEFSFADGSILAEGVNSFAIGLRGSEVSVIRSDVAGRAGASGAMIGAKGRLMLSGSSLSTVDQTSLLMEEATLHAIGSRIEAGNGRLAELSSDAPSHFIFEGGSQAIGDIAFSSIAKDVDANSLLDPTSTMALSGGSHWMGATGALAQVSASSSRWTLTRDSTVGKLELRSSTLALSAPGSSGFNRLTVGGDLESSNSLIIFNGNLGNDDSLVDFLHVSGDTRGDGAIQVNNVHGLGAQTVNGIQLVQVDGASDAVYTMSGRAVAGRYDYFLHKGGVSTPGDGGWYLRSELLPTPPDPCDSDPDGPGCSVDPVDPVDPVTPVDPVIPVDPVGPVTPVDPVNPPPVLRPEVGAYLANIQVAESMFRISYRDRAASRSGGRGWALVNGSRNGSRNGLVAVNRQLHIQGNSQSHSVGVDAWRSESGSAAGVMLSSGNATSTSINSLTGYYARGKVKASSLGVYGTWRAIQIDPYAGFYVDGSLQRAQFRNRVEGVGLAVERYGSSAWKGAVETGYSFRAGGANNRNIYLEPQLQVGYSSWDNLRHTEANGTVVTTQGADGIFGRAGLRMSGITHWRNSTTEVQPYLAAHWLHASAASQIRMDDEVIDIRVPRSRAELSAGASLNFVNGWQAWAGVARQQASGYHQTSAQLGMSYSW